MPSKICLFIISFSNKCQSSWITVGSAGSTGASGIILVLFRYTSYDTAVHESTPLSIGLVVFSVAVLTHFAKRCFSILPICSFQALLLFLNHSITSWMFRASLMTALRCWSLNKSPFFCPECFHFRSSHDLLLSTCIGPCFDSVGQY